jgi:transcriptional regulator with XRE-family HTH domain
MEALTAGYEEKYHIIMTDTAHTPTITRADKQEAALAAAVSARLFELRKAQGLSFDALAQKAGVAKGTLVQIEQQRGNPSISTLCRLAAALDVSVADLVAPTEATTQAVTLLGRDDARQLWTGPFGGTATLLAGTQGPDMLEIWQWVLMPGESFEAAVHGAGTRELIHVTEGTLALTVDGATHLVTAGGSAIALTDRPHAYANPGKEPLRFTMIVHEPAAE